MSNGGGDQFLGQEFKERKAADKNPEQAKFTTKHGAQGVTNPAFADYAKRYPDLQADYEKNWAGKGVSLAEYGASHYATHGRKEGRSLSAPAKTSTPSFASTTPATSAASSSQTQPTTTARAPDATTDDVVAATTQPMQMASLTNEMDLSNKLTEIINTNSPLFKAAQTKALQAMQARGIVNSSLAQEAVMQSILNVALPIAQEEVQALRQNLYYNTDWTNKDRQQANDYQYNSLLTKLQGRINQQLQEMVQSYAAWGKYGDWITTIITQQGADQDAWRRMLDAIRGAGGWPTINQFS